MKQKKILFLIRSLNVGGAERQLVLLASGLSEKGFSVKVVVFYGGGFFEKELGAHNIPVISLGKGGRWDILSFMWRLFWVIKREAPDILHSYLTTSNMISGIAKMVFPRIKVVWGLRASNMDLKKYNWLTRLEFILCRYLSRSADMIIINSQAGAAFHGQKGFLRKNMVVVPNGVETERFLPDPGKGVFLRKKWGIGANEAVIGIVGRLDPMKDHPTFLAAAELVSKENPDVRFVVIGGGSEEYKADLEKKAAQMQLMEKVIWAGQQSDMVSCFNALDVLCLSSAFGEGFPNVVGEAMSCGVPCAVTDVGDAAEIVGDYGEVAPVKNSVKLAESLVTLSKRLDAEPDIHEKVRSRIIEKYSLEALCVNAQAAFATLYNNSFDRL